MPAPILTASATITCPHGGVCTPIASNPTFLVGGRPVLTAADTFLIAGCTFNVSGAPAPCLSVEWTASALSTLVHGVPVLLATSIGLCAGGSPGVPAIVIPGQTQVMGN